eukprot:15683333-Heterocapsa_arctica.AAC.1
MAFRVSWNDPNTRSTSRPRSRSRRPFPPLRDQAAFARAPTTIPSSRLGRRARRSGPPGKAASRAAAAATMPGKAAASMAGAPKARRAASGTARPARAARATG